VAELRRLGPERVFLTLLFDGKYLASSGGTCLWASCCHNFRFNQSRLSRKRKDLTTLARHSSPTSKIFLRRLKDADLPSLAKLWLASWQEAMPAIDFSARLQWFLPHLRALEARGFVTVCAIDGDSIIGFVSIDPSTAYLDQLAVAPAAKGSGVARILLDEARRISPQGIVLDVNEDNDRALAFYKREGFEKIAEGVNPLSGLKTVRLRGPATSKPNDASG
jgi:putative acetyltransferase